MGSKSWLFILAIGICAVLVMGFLTKVAIEANPELQTIIRFKSALADELRGDGVEEVSIRRGPGGSYRVRLSRPPTAGALERLDDRTARYFATNFPDGAVGRVEIAHVMPGSPGCGGGDEYRTTEVALGSVRLRIAEDARRARLEADVAAIPGCRLVSAVRDGRTVRVEVRTGEGAGPAAEVFPRLERLAREAFGASPYAELRVAVGAEGGEPTEARFDPRGRKLPD